MFFNGDLLKNAEEKINTLSGNTYELIDLTIVNLFFDYLEKHYLVNLLWAYPAQNETVALFCEDFKLIKWISFGAMIILIFYGLIRLGISKLKPSV